MTQRVSGTVICDASYWEDPQIRPRPRAFGWAAWVRVTGVQGAIKRHGQLKKGLIRTPAHAELYAALNGIWLAQQYGATDILVRSDCLEVVYIIREKRRGNVKLRKMFSQALKSQNMEHLVLDARHVKAHTGNLTTAAAYVNDWCDKHAKISMREMRKEVLSGRRQENKKAC